MLVNVYTHPLQEILYLRLCSTYPSSDPPPPTPTWMAGYGPACDHYCIILLNPTLKQIGFRNVVLCRGGSSSAPTGGGGHSRGWGVGWTVELKLNRKKGIPTGGLRSPSPTPTPRSATDVLTQQHRQYLLGPKLIRALPLLLYIAALPLVVLDLKRISIKGVCRIFHGGQRSQN